MIHCEVLESAVRMAGTVYAKHMQQHQTKIHKIQQRNVTEVHNLIIMHYSAPSIPHSLSHTHTHTHTHVTDSRQATPHDRKRSYINTG